MKKLNKNYMILSLIICTVIPFLIPSKFYIEGMGRYMFGFPISYVTIYQHESDSMWFGSNFFTGNAGLSINSLAFVLNVLIIYWIITFIIKLKVEIVNGKKIKKTILWIAVLLIVIVGTFWFQNGSTEPSQKGVNVSNWSSSIGGVEEDSINIDRQKLSYRAYVWNDTSERHFITDVKVLLPDSLRNHVITGDYAYTVNQYLDPNATYEVEGELILETKGMSKQEIINLGNIQGFTVETRD